MSDALDARLGVLSPTRRALLQRLLGSSTAAGVRPATAPLSFAQEQLWFLHRLEPDSSAYTVLQILPFTISDLDAFGRAVDLIIDRHEILRTRYVLDGEEPMQVIDPPSHHDIAVMDVEGSTALDTWIDSVASVGFDLGAGPVLRVSVGRRSDGRCTAVLAVHHIAVDGWSMATLLGELRAAYDAFAAGTTPDLGPVGARFADHAANERSPDGQRAVEASLRWWLEQLDGAPQLSLPTDRTRPSRPSHRAALSSIEIDAATTAGLEALSHAEGASSVQCLLAAYGVLLSRWSGQLDVLVGCPSARRSRAGFDKTVGLFVNTVPLRVRLDDRPTFRELLSRVRVGVLAIVEHEDVPFSRVVRELAPRRDAGVNPLFQTTLQLSGRRDSAAAGRSDSRHAVAFDLQVDVAQVADRLVVTFAYDVDLFDSETANRMLGHFQTLLTSIVADPDVPITRLDILAPGERAELARWNSTRDEVPRGTVDELMLRSAAADPQRVAVEDGQRLLTYAELESRSAALAARLRQLDAGRDRIVVVVVPRGIELVVSLLGVLRSGAAFLPVDPDTPSRLLTAIIEQTRPVAVVRSADLEAVPPGVPTVRVDERLPPVSELDQRPADPKQLAYVIATSGSTGTPKMVQIEHASLSSLVHWHRGAYEVTSADRASVLAAVTFDASVWEIWPYLAAGATLVVVPDEVRKAPHALLSWLADERVTLAYVPTPLVEAMTALPMPENLRLRAVLTGGDVLHAAPERTLPFELWNHYGPTECTVVATRSRVTLGDPAGNPPPIGSPISNVEAYVLGSGGELLPVGVVGELYLGGASLARGYHRDPQTTSHAFCERDGVPGMRLYRTGDLVRRLSDGRLRFVGRNDTQLKVRGVRVEAGDIIAQLLSHPLVHNAVVVAVKDSLAAYVVVDPADAPTAEQLRLHLSTRLPNAVIPASFTLLDTFPLTAHHKVDLARLPEPVPAAGSGGALADAVEVAVAEMFVELLGATAIGSDDDFFALGGHSLLATKLAMRTAARFGVEIPLRTIFENTTVRSLARSIVVARQKTAQLGRLSPRPVDRRAYRASIGKDGQLVVNDELRETLAKARNQRPSSPGH